MGVILQLGVACLGNVLVDWNMAGDAMNRLVMEIAHGNDRQKNNRESRFIFHGAQGRTRTDTPCGGGFWVPCVYQFRHLGSGFGLLENDIIKHQYLVSTNFYNKIKKYAWASGVISKNSGLWWWRKWVCDHGERIKIKFRHVNRWYFACLAMWDDAVKPLTLDWESAAWLEVATGLMNKQIW